MQFWSLIKNDPSYLLPKCSRVPLTIIVISEISTIVNGTLLNFGKRYKDNLRVIFDQWPKLHLVLDALSNQKILNGVYYRSYIDVYFFFRKFFDITIVPIFSAGPVTRAQTDDLYQVSTKKRACSLT